MILMSFLEVLGVGSIMPFLAVLGNPNTIQTNDYLNMVYVFLDFKDSNSFLIFLGGFALIMLFSSAFLKSITSYAKFRFSNLRRHSLGRKLLLKYLQQSYSFFLSRNSSEISKTILSETDLAINQAILPALNLITYSLLSISLLTFLIIIDPFLAFILASIFGGFYTIMYLTIRKYIGKIGKKMTQANAERYKITSETIGGIKDIKILGRENIYLENFIKPSYEFSHYTSINQTLSEIPQFLVEVISFGALLSMSIYTLSNDGTDIGTILPVLGLYALGALKLKPAVNHIYKSLATMKFGISALDNIIKDMSLKDVQLDINNNNKRLKIRDTLSLKNIFFNYDNTTSKALENINLNVQINTTVGIIGTTGAGKSTLVDLILCLLTPIKGQLLIDNNEIKNNQIRLWQNSIGYVPQTIFLSDDSIYSNIAFGINKDEINIEKVKEVAIMAQVNEFVLKLNDGYNTIIGERGVKLSGGQRQRLGIARALYNDPELLILDEATSALDNNTEKEVMKAIDNMNGKKTIIIIAHRLSTIERCDMIVTLENGKIVNTENNEKLSSE